MPGSCLAKEHSRICGFGRVNYCKCHQKASDPSISHFSLLSTQDYQYENYLAYPWLMVGRPLSAANKEHAIQHVGVARALFTAEKDVWYDHRSPRISMGFAVETLGGNSSSNTWCWSVLGRHQPSDMECAQCSQALRLLPIHFYAYRQSVCQSATKFV